LREKLEVLQQQPVDYVLLLSFNSDLATMPAKVFVEQLLLEKLSVQLLYVGDDFQFGQGRKGNIELLRSYSQLEIHSLDTYMLDGERVSSTRIRKALKTGDMKLAEKLLGRPYSICGRIAHGFQRGRTIGFPTANIAMARKQSPVHGVYAVRVHGLGGCCYPAVANVGNRPTVVAGSQYWLEVHIFDFSETIYGSLVKVELVEKLREEKKFDSFEQLKEQIVADATKARQLLAC
jgi:riboflavin kinase/FMN adenylyltransferase